MKINNRFFKKNTNVYLSDIFKNFRKKKNKKKNKN